MNVIPIHLEWKTLSAANLDAIFLGGFPKGDNLTISGFVMFNIHGLQTCFSIDGIACF